MIGGLARGLLEAVFPPVCAACPEVGREPFCSTCQQALLPASDLSVEGAEAAFAPWEYGGPVALAVQNLKYRGRVEIGRSLSEALRAHLGRLGLVDVVVPVPLSARRLRERGYNQARELCRALGLPVLPRALVRASGPEQVGLDREARLANLQGVLTPGPQPVKGRAVLLVDDVVTTGATAEASVRALLDAGASRVAVLAVARTEG